MSNGIRRRFILQTLACGVGYGPFVRGQSSQNSSPRPNEYILQAGDFLWPKSPGDIVPYNSGTKDELTGDRSRWLAERDRYLEGTKKATDALTLRRRETLRHLDCSNFVKSYEGGYQAGDPIPYASRLYVGHVGIVDTDSSGTPFVVEALWRPGVVRSSYRNWIQSRPDDLIWVGRLRGFSLDQRKKIATAAVRYLGKPYNFWNFDLSDDREFYCSKLAWLSVFQALGIPVDDDKNPSRLLWFSPKQMLYVPRIDRIHDPGPYAVR